MDFYASVFQRGNNLLVAGYKNQRRVLEKVKYSPYLFVPAEHGEYKTIDNRRCTKYQFDTIADAREFTDKYSKIHGADFYGMSSWPYVYIYDEFTRKNKIDYDRNTLSIVAIDIETDSEHGFPNVETADKHITAITIQRNDTIVTVGLGDFDGSEFPNVTYYKCANESALLKTFLAAWNSKEFSPDIVTGWNIEPFDIPYLVRRITRVLGKEAAELLSPWKVITSREVTNAVGKTIEIFTIVGVATLDYIDLYRKFIVPIQGQSESYRLDFIASEELGERKLDYSEYGDLHSLYVNNHQRYIEYNIRDVDLVFRLDAKLSLIDVIIAMAYDAGINFQDALGTVKPWDCRIHRYLRDRNTVIPFSKISDRSFSIEGGHVKTPQIGMHDWVVSFDLASSYPHQIWQYNIGPETFVDKIDGISVDRLVEQSIDTATITENGKYTITPNGCRFRKDKQSFLSALMEHYFGLRQMYKAKMLEAKQQLETATDDTDRRRLEFEISKYNTLQHSTKISINGLYGSLANAYNRWFDPNLAGAITSSGQLAIRWAEKTLNGYLNTTLNTNADYVIAIDTDSLYVNLGPFVAAICPDDLSTEQIVDFLDTVCDNQLTKILASGYTDLSKYVFAFDQKMQMKREVIANKGIWTGKKHYVINAHDIEGVRFAKPKAKIVGIEAVRSSTPNAARNSIKQAIDIILNQTQDDLFDYIDHVREQFMTLPIDEIAFPRGANDIDKWADAQTIFKKSTPIAVKAALIHNYLLSKLGISRFKAITSGEKIKFAYLKPHNRYCNDVPAKINVIAFADVIPPEFEIEDDVDRLMQFTKGFLAPLTAITDAIRWKTDRTPTLDAFFV